MTAQLDDLGRYEYGWRDSDEAGSRARRGLNEDVVRDISSQGVTVLLVEQNARLALQAAHRGYVMDSGEVTMSGEAKALLADPRVRAAYLGE